MILFLSIHHEPITAISVVEDGAVTNAALY